MPFCSLSPGREGPSYKRDTLFVSLTDGQGLLLNLKGGVLLNSLVLPWNFRLFFITGRSLLHFTFFRG